MCNASVGDISLGYPWVTDAVRTRVKIRQEILDALREFPKTVQGVANAVNCHYNTADRHLTGLEELGKVEAFEQNEKEFWRVVDDA